MCGICGVDSEIVPWANYMFIGGPRQTTRVATGGGCLDCFTTAVAVVAPSDPIPYTDFVRTKVPDDKKKTTFLEYDARRRGKPTRHDRVGVNEVNTISIQWVDQYEPVDKDELVAKFGSRSLAGQTLPWTQQEHVGESKEVVLLRGKPRLEVISRTEIVRTTQKLDPTNHVRAAQGDEFWQAALNKTFKDRLVPPSMSAAELDTKLLGAQANATPPSRMSAGSSRKAAASIDIMGCTPMFPDPEEEDFMTDRSDRQANAAAASPVNSGHASAGVLGAHSPEHIASRQDAPPKRERLLKASTSNPEPPAQRPRVEPPALVQERRGRGSTGRGGTGRGRGGSGVSKKNAGKGAELNVDNLLRGLVHKPKVEMYHRKLRFDAAASTATELEKQAETAMHVLLSAASSLGPEEVKAESQQVVDASIKEILKTMSGDCFPDVTTLGLVKRAASKQMLSPKHFLDICWPCPLIGQLPPATFNPLTPQLRTKNSVSFDDRVKTFVALVVEDFLASHMGKKEIGANAIVGLHLEMEALFSASAGGAHSPAHPDQVPVMRDLRAFVSALGCMVQSTPTTSAQLAAMERLDSGDLPFETALSVLLGDSWWANRRKKVWDTAAYETVSEPVIQSIVDTMASAPLGSSDVVEKWAVARKRRQQWAATLKPSSIEFLCMGLLGRCSRDHDALHKAPDTPDVVQSLSVLVSNLSWLIEEPTPEPVQQRARTLKGEVENTVKEKGAKARLSGGNASLKGMVSSIDSEGVVASEAAQSLANEYDSCAGLPISDDASTMMHKVLATMAGQQGITNSHARLACCLYDLLGVAHSHADHAPWRKTWSGLQLVDVIRDKGQNAETYASSTWEAFSTFVAHSIDIDMIGGASSAVQEAVEEAKAEILKRRSAFVEELAVIAQQAVEELVAIAGGVHSPAGASWKGKLTEASTFDEMYKEAEYHLMKDGKEDMLDKAYLAVETAWARMTEEKERVATVTGCSLNIPAANLKEKKDKMMAQALVTGMELRLIKAFGAPVDKRVKKVKALVSSMGKRQIDPDDLDARVWAQAQSHMQG